jgi:hypothetical protein
MKFFHSLSKTLPALALGCVSLAFLAPAQVAQAAQAQIAEVNGTVSKLAADGRYTQLNAGDSLNVGESISVTALSSARLVFSNGSELMLKENTSVNLASSSQTQTLVELNFGRVDFNVKQLRSGSSFDIESPIGTAAIRGTSGSVELRYNAEREEFLLIVRNNEGAVDIISRYIGEFEYSASRIGEKGFDSGLSNENAEPIPEGHTVIIRLHRDDPRFDALFATYQNFNPTGAENPALADPADPPTFTPDPEDPGVMVVSPETEIPASSSGGSGSSTGTPLF